MISRNKFEELALAKAVKMSAVFAVDVLKCQHKANKFLVSPMIKQPVYLSPATCKVISVDKGGVHTILV